MVVKKIDNYSIEITKQLPTPEPVKSVYQRDFIEEQIIAITKQRDDLIVLKETELKECTDILLEMDKLNIITKPVEKIEEI